MGFPSVAAPWGPGRLEPTLRDRLERLEVRIGEQEAALAGFRESLRLPAADPTVASAQVGTTGQTGSARRGSDLVCGAALYLVGVVLRLVASAILLAVALVAVAEVLAFTRR